MTRIPLAYPKMPNSSAARLEPCIVFEKYDGTNLHWVWERELGWYAFGTRRDRFDLDDAGIADFTTGHPGLEEAATIFREGLEPKLTTTFGVCDFFESEEVTVFTEFLGDNSFAGRHERSDVKRLVVLDIMIGDVLMPPDRFVTLSDELPTARVVYRGKFTGQLAVDVREGRFDVAEGVVCKGGNEGDVWMVKIKTNAYRARLEASFKNNWSNYWE